MADSPITIAVVLATFNRRETTLRCLSRLMSQASDRIRLSVHLLDDASPDGTASAVREAFPQVRVLDGDGQRFWGGGMHLAMRDAIASRFDFMLWLNDDVELKPDALASLLHAHAEASATHGQGGHVILGAVQDPETGEITYSGFDRKNRWHPAQLSRVPPKSDQLTRCDTMNGNCVLIPEQVVRAVGLIDPAYTQQIGDIDYGYRVRRSGARLWIAPDPVGFCSPNRKPRRLRDPSLSLRERLRLLNSPHGLPLRPWLKFMWRYAGPLGPLLLAVGYTKAVLGSGRPAGTHSG